MKGLLHQLCMHGVPGSISTQPAAGESGVVGQGLVQIVAEVSQRTEMRSATTLMSCLSLRTFSKNITNCNLKKTSGSTLGLPSLA